MPRICGMKVIVSLMPLNEALTIGREAKIPVEISHFKLSGQQNWGRSKETVPMIEAARKEGIEVTIDQYPYTASSTSISTLIPDEILADGQDSINARLENPATRKYVINSMLARLKKRKLKHFSYAVVAWYQFDTTYNGKSIEQINLMKGKKHKKETEAETIIDIMITRRSQRGISWHERRGYQTHHAVSFQHVCQ